MLTLRPTHLTKRDKSAPARRYHGGQKTQDSIANIAFATRTANPERLWRRVWTPTRLKMCYSIPTTGRARITSWLWGGGQGLLLLTSSVAASAGGTRWPQLTETMTLIRQSPTN